MDRRLSSLLLFMIILVQIGKNAMFVHSPDTLVHTVQPLELAGQDGSLVSRPVFAIQHLEWLVTIPMILTLAGVSGLGRPLSEVLGPIIVTELYIFLSWQINFVQSSSLHWFLVGVTFVAYGWASMGMFRWVANFWRSASDVPSQEIRAAVTSGLVMLFFAYGIIYLLGQSNAIDVTTQHLSFTFMDFTSKVALSYTFSRVQAANCWQTMNSLVKYLGNLNTAVMSILRGNFDFVVPCVGHSSGWCQLQPCGSHDIMELGRILGRNVAGLSLNELMAAEDQDHFAAYVKNTLRQAKSVDLGNPQNFSLPQEGPIAPVLNCKMLSWAGREQNDPPKFVPVVVHLSIIRHKTNQAHLIAAFRLAPEDCLGRMGNAPPQVDTSVIKCEVREQGWEEPTVSPVDSASNLGSNVGSNVSRTKSQRGSHVSHNPLLKPQAGGEADNAKLDPNKYDDQGSSTRSPSQQHSDPSTSTGQIGMYTEAIENGTPIGGSEVGSQSSKKTAIGSVTMACQQLLGPLHSGLPPKQFVPASIEDHVQCAADMVRRKVPVEIARLHHQQQLEKWQVEKNDHSLSQILVHGRPPDDNIDSQIWRCLVLPALITEEGPGAKPVQPDLPDDTELWRRSWVQVMEDPEAEEDQESHHEHSHPLRTSHPLRNIQLPVWRNYPAHHQRSQ
jgi:hypothetical protein